MLNTRFGFAPVLLALVLLGIAGAPVSAGPSYSQVIAFGDSLSDSGNDFIAFGSPGPPYYNGRFSNGPTWVEYLAGKLGVADPLPSLGGGTNYAYGGATATSAYQGVPYLAQQVQSYLQNSPKADPHALYTVWMGANDFFGGQTDASLPANAVISSLQTLINAGAKYFVVGNMPAQGSTPEYLMYATPAQRAAIDALDMQFNNDLATDLNALRASNPGVVIDLLDSHSLLNSVLKNPSAFGYTDTTDELINAGPNADPNAYLFWDGVHPTTKGHSIIADVVYSQLVPEPAGLTLAAVCGLAVAARTMRRRTARAPKQ